MPGPLLKLITLQDHDGLVYPNELFVGLVKRIADVIQDILPYLKKEKTCGQLIKILQPTLQKNSLLVCRQHQNEICIMVLTIIAKPVLSNICLEKTDSLKRKLISVRKTPALSVSDVEKMT